jgi:hypothetical protein
MKAAPKWDLEAVVAVGALSITGILALGGVLVSLFQPEHLKEIWLAMSGLITTGLAGCWALVTQRRLQNKRRKDNEVDEEPPKTTLGKQ